VFRYAWIDVGSKDPIGALELTGIRTSRRDGVNRCKGRACEVPFVFERVLGALAVFAGVCAFRNFQDAEIAAFGDKGVGIGSGSSLYTDLLHGLNNPLRSTTHPI
jgi:hypothetical protein